MSFNKIFFLDNSIYKWSNINNEIYNIYFKGYIYINSKLYNKDNLSELLKKIIKIKLTENIDEISRNISGNFSLFFTDQKNTIVIVDRIQSYSIFYYKHKDYIYFSNDVFLLKNKFNVCEINRFEKLNFKMSGYTFGNNTLYNDLFKMQAGEYFLINNMSNKFYHNSYYSFFNNKKINLPKKDLIEKLDSINKKTFLKLIETLNGRQVVIPLSGGLDSRAILAFLIKYKYDNIRTYTYGVKGFNEISYAKKIARKVNIEWDYVEFNRYKVKKMFNSQDRVQYFKYASGLNTTPNLSGYFAHRLLSNNKHIDKDAIIINGQSGDFISGDHVPLINDNKLDKINYDFLCNFFINKHYALWTNLLTNQNKKQINNMFKSLYTNSITANLSYQEFSNYFELFEWKERQTKFLINGSRMYEWFGLDWRLPLWDDEYLFFWESVPLKYKLSQNLYKDFLFSKNPSGLFNLNFNIPSNNRKLISIIISLISKITNNKKYHLFEKYFLQYGPYYPHENFFQFSKDALYHRNAVSYWSKYFLDELNNY
tara:strand:+ start:806 stop:2422 length:1617 start_codon:yes stop_codon:yes gene_type:complete